MYIRIFQIALILSCGVIVYLFVKKMPRVGEEVFGNELTKKIRLPKIKLEKVDKTVNLILEKVLRRLKLLLMKLDNATTGFLNRVKESGEFTRKRLPKKSLFDKTEESEKNSEGESLE